VGAGCLPGLAQGVANKIPTDWPDSFKQKAAGLDLSVVETGIFLNAGMLTQQDVELGRKTAALTTTKLSPSDAKSWLRLYKRFHMVDMRSNRMAEVANLITEDYEQQTMSNVVPVGIMDVEGDWFTDVQLDDNVKQKKANKKPTNPKSEKLAFRMASALYTDFFGGSVVFDFSPSRYQGNTGVAIQEISIDLLDGKGYRSIKPSKSTQISYRYTTPGKKAFLIRVKTNKNTFESVSEINIKTVERPKIDQILRVEAERVIRTPVAAGRVGVSGADLIVQLGCDGIFDKPILIIEGFDPFNSNGINWMRTRYFVESGQFQAMQNRGYDLVFLNYWDGTDWIQNNANVVRNTISLINSQKSGQSKIIVVGESMGGIVARYAIRRMEQDGQDPNVSHYISFDAPHKGANVPYGIQTLAIDAYTNLGVNIAACFSSQIRELFSLIGANATPAARQLVRERIIPPPYGSGTLYQHSDFLNLQSELQQMGYPTTCRNLALVCGSLSNARQRYGNDRDGPDEQPGDHIIRMYTWFYGYHVKTINRPPDNGDPNRPTDISRLYGWGDTWRDLASDRNYDINAGGVESNIRTQDGIRFNASFVPTYSAMDWQGDLNTKLIVQH
jgi:pimeloyl-ACP methyl ester carboxylesterase